MLSKAQIGPIVLEDSLSARTHYFTILLDNCLWRSIVRIESGLMRCSMIYIIYTYIAFELISPIPKGKHHNKKLFCIIKCVHIALSLSQ